MVWIFTSISFKPLFSGLRKYFSTTKPIFLCNYRDNKSMIDDETKISIIESCNGGKLNKFGLKIINIKLSDYP